MIPENKENFQVFVICPLYRMLCSYGEACTKLELLRERVCCESCLCVYFSMEETQGLNDFCHTFSNMLCINVQTMHGLCHCTDYIRILYG